MKGQMNDVHFVKGKTIKPAIIVATHVPFKLNKTIRIEVRLPPPKAEAVSSPYAARAPRKWERIVKFVVQDKR